MKEEKSSKVPIKIGKIKCRFVRNDDETLANRRMIGSKPAREGND
jgi:hypothetical protein